MCLAIPGKVLDAAVTSGIRLGRVDFGGITRQTCLDFVPEANPGDYVLVHVGFAITKIDEAEAARTLEMLQNAGLIAEELHASPTTEPGSSPGTETPAPSSTPASP